ncbi:MAG: hypothetical protein ACKPCP_34225 [Sphaerospermopsis kisseleviana]
MTEIIADIPTPYPYRGSGRKGIGMLITFENIPLEQQYTFIEMGFAPGISIESGFSPKYVYPVDLWA